ncbi:MAG: hypothetical protein K2L12_04690 [Clostridia bacterium]|nr:hypothetical protein [Clostridia bacterium]
MNWQTVLEIVATAIASVGGAGAIIWALSSFFGKMWANKILEKQKTEYQKDIEEYKSALSRELEIVKATNERLTYISKVQYDMEISAIKDLTRESHSLLLTCNTVVPVVKNLLKDSEEIILRHNNYYDLYVKSINRFMDAVGNSLAFLEDEVMEPYKKFIGECRAQFDYYNEIFDPEIGFPAKSINKLYKSGETIEQIFDSAIETTKKYLKSLKVAD